MFGLFKNYPIDKVRIQLPFSMEDITKIEDKYTYGTKANPERHCTTFYTENDRFELVTGPMERLIPDDVLEIAKMVNLNQFKFYFLDGRDGLTTGFDILTCSRVDGITTTEINIGKPEALRSGNVVKIGTSTLLLFISLALIAPAVMVFPFVISGRMGYGSWMFMLLFITIACFGFYGVYKIINGFLDEYYIHQAFGISLFSPIPYPVIKVTRHCLSYNENEILWNDVNAVEHSPDKTIIYANSNRQYVIPKYNYFSKYNSDFFVRKVVEYAALVPKEGNQWAQRRKSQNRNL